MDYRGPSLLGSGLLPSALLRVSAAPIVVQSFHPQTSLIRYARVAVSWNNAARSEAE
jgi:hypothetical protein